MVADTHTSAGNRRWQEPKGHKRYKRRVISIYFPPELFTQIDKEAKRRGWPFSDMVVHLCEASIEGIE